MRSFDAAGVCRRETRLVYDRWQTANTYISKPDKGLLTERDQALTACAEAATLTTTDANWAIERFAYDSYGNQIIHHQLAASDGSWDQYVITDYDPVYHLFPVRRFDDAAQTAAYYGVNAVSSGESKGLDDPWASWGSLAEWCDVNEVCVRQAYDEHGRRRFRWDNVGKTAAWATLGEANASVQWDYRDPLNHPAWTDTTITEWHAPRCEGNFVRQHYNAFGLLTQEQRPYQGWSMAYQGCGDDAMPAPEVDVDYAYDALGRQVQNSMPHVTTADWVNRAPDWSAYTAQAYDALGRLVVSMAPNGEATHYQYLGRQTRVLAVGRSAYHEPDKVLKWTETDGLGRLHRVLTGDPSGRQTAAITLTHDVLDNLVQVEQPAGVTTMTYDLAGRKTMMADSDLGTWRYTYFRNGLLRRQTDACGHVITLGYDSVGRLKNKSMAAGANCPTSTLAQRYATVYFTYGSNHSATNRSRGKLTAIIYTYDVYQQTLTYNAKGQLASEQTVIAGAPRFAYATQYGYDAYDRPVATTYPDGEVVTTGYNSMGLATGITATLGVTVTPVVNNAAYDAAGRLTHLHYAAAGVWLSYSYAPWTTAGGSGNGRLLGIAAGLTPGAADVMAAGYDYDSYGNPLRQRLTRGGLSEEATFGYDDQNRLVAEQQAGLAQNPYTWDAAGRLSAMAGLPLTYDSQHGHGVDTLNGTNRYDYDANGNVITRTTTAGVTQALKWDVENRLAAVVTGTIAESYVYDPDGQRIRKQVGSTVTAYPLPGYEQTGSKVTKHYSFGGQAVAVRDATGLYYLYRDRVGSTIHVTNQAGADQASRGYTPYGETRRTEGVMPTDRRFTGQQESATGLYYYGARWYDPETGQFVSPDTIVPDPTNFLDYNRYLYARGNPLVYNDPSGHQATCSMGNDGSFNCTDSAVIGGKTVKLEPATPTEQVLNAPLVSTMQVPSAEEVFNLLWPDKGAAAVGFAGSVGLGLDGVANVGVVYIDHQGNVVIGGGAIGIGGNTGANIDFGPFMTIMPTASSVDVFQGETVSAGISGGEGPGAGFDVNVCKDPATGEPIIGATMSYALSAKANIPIPPIEFHGNVTTSRLSPVRFNVFDQLGVRRPK